MTPWTVALQAPLSMEFSTQEYWSGLPPPPPVYVRKCIQMHISVYVFGLPCGSAGKEPPAMRETWVRSVHWEGTLEKRKAATSGFWPGELHGLYVHRVTKSQTQLNDFIYICMYMLSHFSHVQLFATLWIVASSVHGIFQARILEWAAISSSRGPS